MKTQIKRWGNAAALRIPKAMLKELSLDIGSSVDLKEDHGHLIIEPINSPEPTLQELLEQSPANAFTLDQEDRDWLDDAAIGKEAW